MKLLSWYSAIIMSISLAVGLMNILTGKVNSFELLAVAVFIPIPIYLWLIIFKKLL